SRMSASSRGERVGTQSVRLPTRTPCAARRWSASRTGMGLVPMAVDSWRRTSWSPGRNSPVINFSVIWRYTCSWSRAGDARFSNWFWRVSGSTPSGREGGLDFIERLCEPRHHVGDLLRSDDQWRAKRDGVLNGPDDQAVLVGTPVNGGAGLAKWIEGAAAFFVGHEFHGGNQAYSAYFANQRMSG